MLNSVSTELTKEDSNAQKLQRDRGFWLLSILITVPPTQHHPYLKMEAVKTTSLYT